MPVERADRLQLVHPARERALGMSMLGIDLGAFFITVREIGRDPALVLLAARALALRGGGAVRFNEIGWVLGMTRRGVVRGLRRLSSTGAVVWHEEVSRGVVAVEVVPDLPGERAIFGPDDVPPFSSHAIPTHWFVQVLPLLGRRTFLAYLFIRSRERRDGLTSPLLLSAVIRACRLTGHLEAGMVLRRLARRALVVPIGQGRYAVFDPRPPSGFERRLLRLRSSGVLPPTAIGRLGLALAITVPVAVLLFLLLWL